MNNVRQIQLREYEFTESRINSALKDTPRQGELWTVTLKGDGYKMDKTRPCIIAQSNDLNDKLKTTFIVPITGSRYNRGNLPEGDKVYHETDLPITEDLIEYFRFPEGVYGTGIITQGTTVDMNESLGKFIGKLNSKGIELLIEKLNKRY